MSDLFSSSSSSVSFSVATVPPLVPLVWAAAQVTAVTAAACVAERLARRAGPRAGGTAALAGLAAAAALSLAVFSPWPRWEAPAPAVAAVSPDEPDAIVRAAPAVAVRPAEPGGASLAGARAFAAGLLDPPREAPEAEVRPDLGFGGETRRPVRWGLLLAAALLAAGLARFALGWLLVVRLRRRAAAVTDDETHAEFAALAAAAGVRGDVELLETGALTTAAAVGWRRPAVLLPAGWRGWAPADRTAVLAHELAHVAAGDFGRNLLAQSLLLAQFYHPLAHWLAGRVRADQELAADAAAAGLCGGPRSYLKSLAAVALSADPGPRRRGLSRLSLSSEPALWPARAFLPTRRSLHERVEMLRKPPVPLTRRAKYAGPLAAAGVLCVAAVASGFRPAPAPPADGAPDATAETLRQSRENLTQIGLAMHNHHSTYGAFPPAVVVENGVERSWRVELLPFLPGGKALYDAYRKDEPWDSDANKRVLAEMPAVYRHPADDRDEPYAGYFAVIAENPEAADGRLSGPTAWRPRGLPGQGYGLRDLLDGTTATALAVESKRPVPWTKPEDVTYDAAEDLDDRRRPNPPTAEWVKALGLGGFTPGVFQAVFGDGSVRAVGDETDPHVVRGLLTRQGGEVIDTDAIPAGPAVGRAPAAAGAAEPELTEAQTKLAERWAAALRETRGHMPMAFNVAAGMVARTDADGEAAAPLAAELAWKDLPGKDEKRGLLKAFSFSKGRPDQHPGTVRALHLGMTDGGRDVRETAAYYLEEFALTNFADDMPAYRAWYAKYGGLPLAEVRGGQRSELGELIDGLADDLAAGGGAVSPEARALAEKIAGFGDPAAIPELIGLLDSASDVWETGEAKGAGAKRFLGPALSRLASVPYSEAHDGTWWRAWWSANRDRYPEAVSRVDVPDYRERLRAAMKAAAEGDGGDAE